MKCAHVRHVKYLGFFLIVKLTALYASGVLITNQLQPGGRETKVRFKASKVLDIVCLALRKKK